MITVTSKYGVFGNAHRKTSQVPFVPGLLVSSFLDVDYEESKTVTWLNGAKCTHDQEIHDNDVIYVVYLPADPVSLTLAEQIFITIGLGLLSRVLAPSLPARSRDDESSPTYNFTGIQNNRGDGFPIPIPFGKFRVGGQIINEFVEARGELGSYYNVLICLAEEQVQSIAGITTDTAPEQPYRTGVTGFEIPEGIQVNGIDASTLKDVEVHVRLGTNEQLAIPGFELTNDTVLLDRKLDATDSNSDSLEYILDQFTPSTSENALWDEYGIVQDFSTDKIDSFTVTVECPTGLGTISSTGVMQPWYVAHAVRYIELDEDGDPITTGGPDGDGYVRLRPSAALSASSRSSIRADYRYLCLDPQTFTLPTLGKLLSVNFEWPFEPMYLQKTSPTLPVSWTAGSQVDEVTVMTWVCLRPGVRVQGTTYSDGTGSTAGTIDDTYNCADNPIVDLLHATNGGFRFSLGTRNFTLAPGHVRQRIVPIVRVGAGSVQTEYYEKKGQTGDVSFRAKVHKENDVPRSDWALIGFTYKSNVDGTKDRLRIFVNGNVVYELIADIGMTAPTSATLFVGKHANSNTTLPANGTYPPTPNTGNREFFKGHLDELVIFNSERTPFQMGQSYNNGLGISHTSSSRIIGLYHFDVTQPNGTGQTALDSGPRSNSLTTACDAVVVHTSELRVGGITGFIDVSVPTNTKKRSWYRVEVMRATAFNTNPQRLNELNLSTLTSHIDQQFSHPGCALLGLRIKADDQVSGQRPTITTIMEGVLCPVWNGTSILNPTFNYQYTKNPAWVLAFLCLNPRSGIGQIIKPTDIDVTSLQTMADYADEPVYDQRGRRMTYPDWSDMRYDSSGGPGGIPAIEIRFPTGDVPSHWVEGQFVGWYNVPIVGGVDTNVSPTGGGGYEILAIVEGPSFDSVYVAWEGASAPWPNGTLLSASATLDGTIEGRERRFEYDGVLDKAQAAWDVLLQVASTARSVPMRVGSKIKFFTNMPRVPSDIITEANIYDKSLVATYASPYDKENSYVVDFADKDLEYTVSPYAQEHPSVQTSENSRLIVGDISLDGVVRRSQVARHVRFMLNVNYLLNLSGKFDTSIDTVEWEPGEVVLAGHRTLQAGVSGRVNDSNTVSSIYLDRDVTLESGETYYLSIRNSQAVGVALKFATRQVSSAAGFYPIGTPLTLLSNLDDAPVKGDKYILYTTNQLQTIQVVGVSLSQGLRRTIDWIEYNEEVYNVEGVDDLEDVPIGSIIGSSDNAPPDPVTELSAQERLIRKYGGGLASYLYVSWKKPNTAVEYYVVYISEDGGPYYEAIRARSGSTDAYVPTSNVRPGTTVRVSVQGVSLRGIKLHPELCPGVQSVILGLSPSPAAPSGLSLDVDGSSVRYSWSDPDTKDGAVPVLRVGGPNSWILAQEIGTGPAGATFIGPTVYWVSPDGATDPTYKLRKRSAQGSYSDEAVLTTTVEVINAEDINDWPDNSFFTESWETFGDGWKWDDSTVPNSTLTGLERNADGNLQFSGTDLTGTYQTALSTVAARSGLSAEPVFVSAYAEAEQVHPQTWEECTWGWDDEHADQVMWEGPINEIGDEDSPGSCTLEIWARFKSSTQTWSDWAVFKPGVVVCISAQFRLVCTRPNDNFNIKVTRFSTKLMRVPPTRYGRSSVSLFAQMRMLQYAGQG